MLTHPLAGRRNYGLVTTGVQIQIYIRQHHEKSVDKKEVQCICKQLTSGSVSVANENHDLLV